MIGSLGKEILKATVKNIISDDGLLPPPPPQFQYWIDGDNVLVNDSDGIEIAA